MPLRLPGKRSLSRVLKRVNRDVALQECLHDGPKRTYGGLLHYSRGQKHKDGWAYYRFIEIFGTKPRSEDRGPPMPPTKALLTWISLLPKKSKR